MGCIAGRGNKIFELFLFNCITNKVFVNAVERLPLTKILHNPGGADLGIMDRYYGSRMQPLQFAQSQSKQV